MGSLDCEILLATRDLLYSPVYLELWTDQGKAAATRHSPRKTEIFDELTIGDL